MVACVTVMVMTKTDKLTGVLPSQEYLYISFGDRWEAGRGADELVRVTNGISVHYSLCIQLPITGGRERVDVHVHIGREREKECV